MISTVPTSPASLPLRHIRPGLNPRRYFDQRKHEELVASLKLRGMLQPMLLRPVIDTPDFAIVAGERRYKAALEAFGADGEVPVIVRDLTDQEALEAAIDENDVRDDASETEQADAAVRVLAACQNDRVEAAKRLGWSPAKLDRRLALAGLSEAVKLALDERRIKVGHAELLAAVPGDKQDKALDTILRAGLDVAKTRELLMRVTQALGGATFDKTECTTCPFNSGSQRALFETHVEDGHCTNPGCFQLKTDGAAPVVPVVPEPGPGPAAAASAPTAERAAPAITSAAPAKAASQPASAKPKVTVQSLKDKLASTRQRAWREAVAATIAESGDHLRVADLAASLVKSGAGLSFDQVAGLVPDFEVDLRATWSVDRKFLDTLNKDELKFVAQECGLVAHVGEKAFAKLLTAPTRDLITGMMNATGFIWAGRLPSAMTLDGKYGPPPAAAPLAYKD